MNWKFWKKEMEDRGISEGDPFGQKLVGLVDALDTYVDSQLADIVTGRRTQENLRVLLTAAFLAGAQYAINDVKKGCGDFSEVTNPALRGNLKRLKEQDERYGRV
jgi:hypothetical protein